ncbi:MAG: ParB/RepB/Spo0J family partition protein [Pseudomonadota bacterium]
MAAATEKAKKRLGKGLAALIGDVENDAAAVMRARSQRRVPIEFLDRNPRNPRTTFGDEDLAELTASVKEKGIVQPILVRPLKNRPENFEIIAGERRWRAAQRAGLHEVPVVVQDVSDKEALELAIIENVQRADLNPVEEARGYGRLMEEFAYKQVDLAQVIGKSRSHVANTLRLLKLPQAVQDKLAEGALSAGHARALITADDPEGLAREIVDGGLSVRDAEALAQAPGAKKGGAPKKPEKDADTRALEKRLADAIGLAVSIQHKANGSGEVRFKYHDVDQLEVFCRNFGVD